MFYFVIFFPLKSKWWTDDKVLNFFMSTEFLIQLFPMRVPCQFPGHVCGYSCQWQQCLCWKEILSCAHPCLTDSVTRPFGTSSWVIYYNSSHDLCGSMIYLHKWLMTATIKYQDVVTMSKGWCKDNFFSWYTDNGPIISNCIYDRTPNSYKVWNRTS